MKTIITDLGEYKPEYPIELLADPADVLFMDIETTGLTPANTNLYLIGCAYFENDEWHVIQWFAEKYEEELTLLTAFFDFVKKYKYLIMIFYYKEFSINQNQAFYNYPKV